MVSLSNFSFPARGKKSHGVWGGWGGIVYPRKTGFAFSAQAVPSICCQSKGSSVILPIHFSLEEGAAVYFS